MSDEYTSAKYYDAFLYIFVRRIRKKILEIVIKNKYKKILDVCCGTGDQLKLFKKHGIDAIGIDLSKAMLDVAKTGSIKIKCFEQDAENIEFEDETFDLTTTTFALHEKTTESAKLILNEMLRLTKIGGDIIIVDFLINRNTSVWSKTLITAIEYLAGGEHYKNYKNYVATRGLDNILNGLPLKLIVNHTFAMRGITLKVLRKTSQ